jgi:hypothetical protein
MSRLWIALVAAVAVFGIVPAAAQADGSSSNITSWSMVTPDGKLLTNPSYLVSYDNPAPTKGTILKVSGTASPDLATGGVDLVCYYGAGSSFGVTKPLAQNVPVTNGPTGWTFSASGPLKPIASHACRLRAIPSGQEGVGTDTGQYAGPLIAVSEAALPTNVTADNQAYDFYLNGTTFMGTASWNAAGSCGPFGAPLGPAPVFGTGNFAIDCMGSLLGSNMSSSGTGTRSEVQVDGRDAYDAPSLQAVFEGTENLAHFPSLTANANWDPTTGLVSSSSTEGWVVCPGLTAGQYPPTNSNCPDVASAGVSLERDVSMSDGGLMVTVKDIWSSVDGMPHSLDLLYDDLVGLKSLSAPQPGYQFPGQSAFAAYGAGDKVQGPGGAPGSIFVHTNRDALDGDQTEAYGAITFSTPPSDFEFAGSNEFAEHQVLHIPAGGFVQLTYAYSTGYTLGAVQALAQAAQARMQPAVAITSQANGATVSTPSVTVSGTANAGSGIPSLFVAGSAVPVDRLGGWEANVPLSPGSNTIVATGTDATGANAQAQVTITYQPPAVTTGSLAPPVLLPPTPAVTCKVPQLKGLKLRTAERRLRHAHCRVGKIRHVHSRHIANGRVVSTSPRARRERPAGSKVELFVSEGP